MEHTIFQRGSFRVFVCSEPTEQHLELLDKTTVGTKGAQYLLKTIRERTGQTIHQYWMSLEKDRHLVGTFCTAHREVSAPFGRLNAYYVRYFAFKESVQASKETGKRVKSPEGFFKSFTKKFFTRAPYEYGIDFGEDRSLPYLTYAYIDSENLRSSNMSEMFGFENMSSFDTYAFSRLYPKNFKQIEILPQAEYAAMRDLLREHYQSFALYDEQYLFIKDNYYVWRENGRIVAGVQINRAEWEMVDMGGLTGKIMLGVIPHTPYIRKFFNPKKFEFATFDYLYHIDGYEDRLEKLLTGLLNRYNLNFSLNWHEVKSPYHSFFKNKVSKGFLATFSKVPSANYMMITPGLTDEQREQIRKSPLFMCGMDMS